MSSAVLTKRACEQGQTSKPVSSLVQEREKSRFTRVLHVLPESLKKLNDFLVSRDFSAVRYRVKGMLSEAAERTKREHLRKVRQGIVTVEEIIAPGQKDETEQNWHVLVSWILNLMLERRGECR